MAKEGRIDYPGRRLVDGMWAGQPVYVVGGGSSLSGFDWNRLRGHLVIGTNRTYEAIDPAINLCLDQQFVREIERGNYGAWQKGRWGEIKAVKAIGGKQAHDTPDGMEKIQMSRAVRIGALSNELGHGGNSGFAALNLAIALGGDPIYLLGIDMKPGWWHTGHVRETSDLAYKRFLRRAEQLEVLWKDSGRRIVNLNPESALRCFEFGSYDQVEPRERPLVVSFYTPDPLYRRHAREMELSAHMFGLETDIRCAFVEGSWDKITRHKAIFMRNMLQEHKRPVIWIDADARILEYPDAFDSFLSGTAELALCRMGWGELNSAVMGMKPTDRVFRLIDAWIAENERTEKNVLEQKCLDDALQAFPPQALAVTYLPESYVRIFDNAKQRDAGVKARIIQLQASRKSRFRGDRS